MVLAISGVIAGIITASDSVRPHAKETIERLEVSWVGGWINYWR